MKRPLVLLLLATMSLPVASCAARRPANDEVTIRLNAPAEETPQRSGRSDAAVAVRPAPAP